MNDDPGSADGEIDPVALREIMIRLTDGGANVKAFLHRFFGSRRHSGQSQCNSSHPHTTIHAISLFQRDSWISSSVTARRDEDSEWREALLRRA
jgi:truncated hemoglobin YjbI